MPIYLIIYEGNFTGDWWIPLTKGQLCDKHFNVMMFHVQDAQKWKHIQLFSPNDGVKLFDIHM